MSKIIEAEDILADARDCVQCVFMAAANLSCEEIEIDPIQSVANVVRGKIDAAIALLNEYRTDIGAGPVAVAPSTAPKSPAARTKRKGK